MLVYLCVFVCVVSLCLFADVSLSDCFFFLCVCVVVCLRVCVFGCFGGDANVHLCLNVGMSLCRCVFVRLCLHVLVCLRVHVSVRLFGCVCAFLRLHACV